MTDPEWSSWQSTWSGATGPLPDVRARAQREVRLHRLANVAFFLLVAIALFASASTFTDPSRAVRTIGWTVMAFIAAMSIGYLSIQRGIGLRRTGSPRDALGFLERRLRVERLTAHLVRWAYAGLFLVFVFVFPNVVAGHSAPRLEMAISFSFMVVFFVLTFSAPCWVARRNQRHQEEIDRWRRWMDDENV
jgi:hypothetical protein